MSEINPLSFRVTAHQRKLLEDQAQTLGLRSPDLVARKIVVEHLSGETESPLTQRLEQLATELAEARADLSVATEVILVHAGKLQEEAAHEWVTQNLKPR